MFLKSILFIVLSLMFCDGNNVYYEADCFQEQSCFAGYYNQNHTYEGSEDSYVLSLPNDYDGYIRFDMDHKEIDSINGTSSESLLLSDLYAPRYDGYEFASFENTNYPEFDGENSNELFGMNWGPKDPYVNSVCKIRAYYHNVAFNNGLVTVMYDFTGFLVGDSLLMTTAHGLCLDVTCGLFDDGVEDLYFPGKIEVYGAIGLADVWGNSYGYYSLATEIFMNSDYVRNRITQNDWALLRLDRPLGRELSYKVIKSWDLPTSPMKLIGYPMFNQFHQRLNADNIFATDGGEVYRYFADTLDGMSGSPLYNTDLRAINNFNIYEHPFAEERVAYGMHVKKNVNTGECLAIKFTDEHKTIVRALNKKCEPDTVRLLPARNNYLSYVNGRTISVGQEILCEVSASNVYEGSGAFRFCSADSSERLAYLDFEFNMPISTIRFSFSIIGASNGAELFCSAKDYFDHNEQFNIVENGIKTNKSVLSSFNS